MHCNGFLSAFRAKTSFFFLSVADQSLQHCIDFVVGGDGSKSDFFCRDDSKSGVTNTALEGPHGSPTGLF